MCAAYDIIVKEFQTNLASFVNAAQTLSICTQNLAKIMGSVDPNQTIVNKSVPALLDWGQNLFILAERFELDAKSQLSTSLDKEQTHPEACSIRMTMGNIYEKVLFFLNHMTHSYIDYSRSESPMSASYECQVPQVNNPSTLQRFRTIQQQQQYRRWSEAAATAMEPNEANVDSNRRWSMPTNVSKTQSRFIPMMNKLAGLVNQQSQTTIPDQTTMNSDGVVEAIQLLSFRAPPSRPPSHCTQQSNYSAQQQQTLFRNQSQPSQRQRQSRAELNEILVLPRASDPLYLGRYQQIAENIRGEKLPVFKNKTLQEPGPKKRMWKSLKQIQTSERNSFGLNSEAVLYSTINAPPSFRPPKKYSDISGLIGNYCDPHTKLYYHNADEYQTMRKMPGDLVKGYLTLRGASSVV
ncbi:CLUMA_CG007950, isoform A [Clunio marinus]|uniref:CLUMA_CG007950, isoform A n=1 Tax=Clunio marinus TaxID=568069 RepID=A0A1J1I2L5_9DIPT|nr:CLUMA_CG007950, isoform A [Clunio marinus]